MWVNSRLFTLPRTRDPIKANTVAPADTNLFVKVYWGAIIVEAI